MLAINVTVEGDKVIIDGLQALSAEMPKVLQRGLKRISRGVHREAMEFLSGPGRTPMRLTNLGAIIREGNKVSNQKSRLRGQSDALGARPGSYPVPVITGNLRRLLDFLDPGQSKGGFSAGPSEVIIYDSAGYASVIRDATYSSSGYQHRDFLNDGLEKFNQGGKIAGILEEELQTEITKRGLA